MGNWEIFFLGGDTAKWHSQGAPGREEVKSEGRARLLKLRTTHELSVEKEGGVHSQDGRPGVIQIGKREQNISCFEMIATLH